MAARSASNRQSPTWQPTGNGRDGSVIVVDASVVANALGDDGPSGRRARELLTAERDIAAPELVDVETAAVFRRRWLGGTMSGPRFDVALADLIALPLTRYAVRALLTRVGELRATVTAYDACYVALAEALDADLVTADQRLTRAPGPLCRMRLVSAG